MILIFYRTILSCLEAEKCVKFYFKRSILKTSRAAETAVIIQSINFTVIKNKIHIYNTVVEHLWIMTEKIVSSHGTGYKAGNIRLLLLQTSDNEEK